jgi:hypothetical protein
MYNKIFKIYKEKKSWKWNWKIKLKFSKAY